VPGRGAPVEVEGRPPLVRAHRRLREARRRALHADASLRPRHAVAIHNEAHAVLAVGQVPRDRPISQYAPGQRGNLRLGQADAPKGVFPLPELQVHGPTAWDGVGRNDDGRLAPGA